MGRQICRWSVFRTAEEVLSHAAGMIAGSAGTALVSGGRFRIVVSGGRTPPLIYDRLQSIDTDWGAWEIFFSDERCLPPAHADRNDRLAWDAWLSRLGCDKKPDVYPIPAELGPEQGAAEYARLIGQFGPLDFALLGVGEDGHTASLFPGVSWRADADDPPAIPVFGAPKWPPERISLSATRLSRISTVVFVAVGVEKRAAIAAWRAGADLPVAAIRPANGVDVLLDKEAAGGIL